MPAALTFSERKLVRNNRSGPLDVALATCKAGAVTSPPKLNIVLHQPEIPQNTGNVGRSCLAVGAKLWLVRPLGFQLDEKQLRRAGLDYWQHLDVEVVDHWESLATLLPAANHWYFSKTAEQIYTDVEFSPGDSLVFGSETRGLPGKLLANNPQRALRIPIYNPVRSLNLASAVAVAALEAQRQWRARGLIGDTLPSAAESANT